MAIGDNLPSSGQLSEDTMTEGEFKTRIEALRDELAALIAYHNTHFAATGGPIDFAIDGVVKMRIQDDGPVLFANGAEFNQTIP